MRDPHRPVIVGIAEAKVDSDDPIDPYHWLASLVREAGVDAGAPGAITAIDTVALVEVAAWKLAAPATHLSGLLGASAPTRMVGATGGNAGQALMNQVCERIQSGQSQIALVGGVERLGARMRSGRTGTWLDWESEAPDLPPDPIFGSMREGTAPDEMAAGAHMPLDIYPLMETARRHRLDMSVEEYDQFLGTLISQCSQVAAQHPVAWHRNPLTPEEAVQVTEKNRMISAPYRRCMVADIGVDQAAAILLMSEECADSYGIPQDRRVYPIAGAEAVETYWFTRRAALDASPALDAAAATALRLGGICLDRAIGNEDIARFNLYSCFPVALSMGAKAFGIPDPTKSDRPLTLTGGLARFGGPASNYATHGIVAMARAAREHPTDLGIATALGWYATKHAVGLYSGTPGTGGFQIERLADRPETEVEIVPPVANVMGTVEGSTAIFDREGTPTRSLLSARTEDGKRFLVRSDSIDIGVRIASETVEGLGIQATVEDDHFVLEDLA